MACCGPKLSVCGTVLSIWGCIMLGLMGLFFYLHSPALAEDLPIDEKVWEEKHHSYEYVTGLYQQAAYNCWIASGAYVLLLVVSGINMKLNFSASYAMQ